MREKNVTVLGPYKRYGLWVSGCNRKCPGCISPESHDMKSGKAMNVNALAWEIYATDTEGITISGGEPFLQAEALTRLIRAVRKKRDVGVIIYTGFLLEELENTDDAKELLKECDLLIDGPYIKELDDGKSLRGSSNQRVIPLTDRYLDKLHLYGQEGREVQKPTHFGVELHYIGIPTDSKY